MNSLLPAIRDDFERRDVDFIRDFLPILWLLASFWDRAEVRGLEKIPPNGPVLLLGNHPGGNMTPDTTVFVLACTPDERAQAGGKHDDARRPRV